MKSMRPPLAAIFFMTYFHRAGGGHGPLGPPWIRYWCSMEKILTGEFHKRNSWKRWKPEPLAVTVRLIPDLISSSVTDGSYGHLGAPLDPVNPWGYPAVLTNTPECRGNDWLFGNLVSRSFYAICQFVVRKWFNSSASSTRKTDIEKCRQGWNVISFRKIKWKHRKRDSVSFPLVSKRVFPWLQRKITITINVIVTNVEDGHKQKHVKFSKERVQIRKRGKVCIVYHNFS